MKKVIHHPKYVITSDGYIGTFRRSCEWGAEYTFTGGSRYADNWEIANGTDDHDEAKRIAVARKKIICPRCGNALAPSDVEGYAFVCYECDENFYKIEVK